jgi:hypothetical protein
MPTKKATPQKKVARKVAAKKAAVKKYGGVTNYYTKSTNSNGIVLYSVYKNSRPHIVDGSHYKTQIEAKAKSMVSAIKKVSLLNKKTAPKRKPAAKKKAPTAAQKKVIEQRKLIAKEKKIIAALTRKNKAKQKKLSKIRRTSKTTKRKITPKQ